VIGLRGGLMRPGVRDMTYFEDVTTTKYGGAEGLWAMGSQQGL